MLPTDTASVNPVVFHRLGRPVLALEIYEKLQEILYAVVDENPHLLETDLEQLVSYKSDSPVEVWLRASPTKAIQAMNASQPDFNWDQLWTARPEDNYNAILMMLYCLHGLADN